MPPKDPFALKPGTPVFPIVISGPSGAGKTVLIARLLELEPWLVRSITATTRAPRPGEQNAIHYHFHSEDTMRRMIQSGDFLETAQVHDHLYGTPKKPLEANLKAGKGVILNIDVQGALQVRKSRPDAILIFLIPPSMQILETRLRQRNTDDPTEIARRLQDALDELARVEHYDYLVVNDDLDTAVTQVRHIIEAERFRVGRLG